MEVVKNYYEVIYSDNMSCISSYVANYKALGSLYPLYC